MEPSTYTSTFLLNPSGSSSGAIYNCMMTCNLASLWTLARPSSCSFEETYATFPEEGTGCLSDYEVGAVAWSKELFQADSSSWMMVCNEQGNWIVPANLKTKSNTEMEGKKWARINVDTANEDGSPDSQSSWTKATTTFSEEMTWQSGLPSPSGWKHGGSLFICLGTMANDGSYVARISSIGKQGDTPTCAAHHVDKNSQMIGSDDCPLAETPAAFALAKPSACSFEKVINEFPNVGQGCSDDYEVGAVVWSRELFNADSQSWMLVCSSVGLWTVPSNLKSSSTLASENKIWARVNVDNTNAVGSSDLEPAWTRASTTFSSEMTWQTGLPSPSGWEHGGSLFICLGAMSNNDPYVARISSIGKDGDTPTCATNHIDWNGESLGSAACPIVETPSPFAVARPSSCSFEEIINVFPMAGQGCTTEYEVGAAVWSKELFMADSEEWMLVCSQSGYWIVPSNLKVRTTIEMENKVWARLNADSTNEDGYPDAEPAWTNATAIFSSSLTWQSGVQFPSFWPLGGSLFVCLGSLYDNGPYVARISSKGVDGDTPVCANNPIDLNADEIGTLDCPLIEAPTPAWGLARPSCCSFEELLSPFPTAGADCLKYFEVGAVAWSSELFNEESTSWLLYCDITTGTWTVPQKLKAKTVIASEGKFWARVSVDKTVTEGSFDNPPAWLSGGVTFAASISWRSDSPFPSQWGHGGSLNICLEPLADGRNVARISSMGKPGDTPSCAFTNIDLNGAAIGGSECPRSTPVITT